MMPATNKEKWYKISISQIFPNKKRRNLKKGKRLIGIVLKEGIKVEVSKKMEKWAAQELQYADLGDRRRKKRLISIVEVGVRRKDY